MKGSYCTENNEREKNKNQVNKEYNSADWKKAMRSKIDMYQLTAFLTMYLANG